MGVVIDATGGAGSPILAGVHLHVLLAASLIGVVTGLHVALGHALALYLVHAAATAWGGAEGDGSTVAVHAAAFLLVAGGAAVCGHLQGRAARRGRSELRALADLGPRLAAAPTPDAVAAVVATAAVDAFGFVRAVAVPVGIDGVSGTTTRHRLEPGSELDALLPGGEDVAVVAATDFVLVAEWGARRHRPLLAETLAALTEATSHAALAAATATLRGELHTLATTDGLTALVNRAAFDEELAAALADRRAQPVSVALVDLDHFKSVNDSYGHQVGDEVLRRAADAVRSVVRPGDTAARYGGEELVVVLPRCPALNAAGIAERLRAAIAATPGEPTVTASIGVATASIGTTPADLLAAADAALYDAKRSGRDRVVRARRRPAPAATSS